MTADVRKKGRRRGAAAAEAAVVIPAFLALVLGMIVTCMGVFRYNQVASLARDASRWASVQGTTQGAATPTSAAVTSAVLTPRLIGLDPAKLTCQIRSDSGFMVVTLTYQWTPEFLIAPITLRSEARSPITY